MSVKLVWGNLSRKIIYENERERKSVEIFYRNIFFFSLLVLHFFLNFIFFYFRGDICDNWVEVALKVFQSPYNYFISLPLHNSVFSYWKIVENRPGTHHPIYRIVRMDDWKGWQHFKIYWLCCYPTLYTLSSIMLWKIWFYEAI